MASWGTKCGHGPEGTVATGALQDAFRLAQSGRSLYPPSPPSPTSRVSTPAPVRSTSPDLVTFWVPRPLSKTLRPSVRTENVAVAPAVVHLAESSMPTMADRWVQLPPK